MTKIVEDFKTRYRTALVMTGMKAVEISRKTGIPETTLSQYLSGYSKPKDKRLGILADALGVDPSWLMGFDVPMNSKDISDNLLQNHIDIHLNGRIAELMNVASDMNDAGLRRLLQYAEDIQDKYKKGEDNAEEIQ